MGLDELAFQVANIFTGKSSTRGSVQIISGLTLYRSVQQMAIKVGSTLGQTVSFCTLSREVSLCSQYLLDFQIKCRQNCCCKYSMSRFCQQLICLQQGSTLFESPSLKANAACYDIIVFTVINCHQGLFNIVPR